MLDFIGCITFIEDYGTLNRGMFVVPTEISHCYEIDGYDGIFCLDSGCVIASDSVTI